MSTAEKKKGSCSLLRADHLQNQEKICWFRPMTASNLDDIEAEACSRPAPGLAAAQPTGTILRVRLGPLASFLGGGHLENLCTSRVFGTWSGTDLKMKSCRGQAVFI